MQLRRTTQVNQSIMMGFKKHKTPILSEAATVPDILETKFRHNIKGKKSQIDVQASPASFLSDAGVKFLSYMFVSDLRKFYQRL